MNRVFPKWLLKMIGDDDVVKGRYIATFWFKLDNGDYEDRLGGRRNAQECMFLVAVLSRISLHQTKTVTFDGPESKVRIIGL